MCASTPAVTSNIGCDHCFLNLRDLKIHEVRSQYHNHFEVDHMYLGLQGPYYHLSIIYT